MQFGLARSLRHGTRVIHFPNFSIIQWRYAMKPCFSLCKLVATTVALTFVLGACNTIQGAGKDIERGGQKIERAADKAKD